uniref:ATP synthase complex subunit 8 n=1 Tax=Kiwa tyleri TaxID=1676998 RepID=A0A343CXB8_KIWTY|nr:ATP synthase F0 subunit 8 [Kiwa tyleri]ARQ27013.1 ATP synthase F0 subunit 8 [Kiwa tyleri]
MPQMAPLLWLNLMLMFLISFILFFIMNYFIYIPSKMESYKKLMNFQNKFWKW